MNFIKKIFDVNIFFWIKEVYICECWYDNEYLVFMVCICSYIFCYFYVGRVYIKLLGI